MRTKCGMSRAVVAIGMAGCVGVNQLLGEAEDHSHADQCPPERQGIVDICMTAVTSNTTTTQPPQSTRLITT